MKDPREHVETENVAVRRDVCVHTGKAFWIVGDTVNTGEYGEADWPELVELAQKILAADEAWKDANTPTLDELRAKYPEWCLDVLTTELNVIAMYEHRELETVCGFADVASEPQGIRWLAAKLEELTDGK